MIYGQTFARRARMWKNHDGEFGQVTGWLLKIPYMAYGGMTSVNVPLKDVSALDASGLHAALIRFFGRKVSGEREHGKTLYGLGQHFYRLRPNSELRRVGAGEQNHE